MDLKLDRRRWLKLAAVGAPGFAASGASVAPAVARADSPARRASPARSQVLAKGKSGKDYAPALAALRSYIDLHLVEFGLPGMTFSVADADGFVALVTAGEANVDRGEPVAPHHLFQIGSISKSLCGIAVLRLADQGKLKLDDDVRAHLPGVALPDGAKLTLVQLLNHTSGLPHEAPLFPRGSEGLWLGFAPGAQFSYSNTGYALLGAVVERFSGRPYGEALKHLALDPLGMTAAVPEILTRDRDRYAVGYGPRFGDRPYVRRAPLSTATWLDFTDAAGSVAATPADMSNYLRFLITAGRGKTQGLLSTDSAKRFTSPAVAAPDFGPKAHYACGLAIVPIDERPCLHHTGGMEAFSSSLHVDPAAGVGAFASTNASAQPYRPRLITTFACQLFRAVREGRPLPAPPPIVPATRVEKASRLAGRYAAPDGAKLELRLAGEGLVLNSEGGDHVVQPAEGGLVAVSPDGTVRGLGLAWDGDSVTSIGFGARLYLPEGKDLSAVKPLDPALARLAGRYVSTGVFTGQTEVVARPDGLWLDGVTKIVPHPDGTFRLAEDAHSPERFRFDGDLDGRPWRMIASGVDCLRS